MKLAAILNTRPLSESSRTIDTFHKYGFETLSFPCIEITSVNNLKQCHSLINNIPQNTIIVFTSIQAVIHAFEIVPEWKISEDCIVITVGSKTAEELKKHIHNEIRVPKLQNSDGVIKILEDLKSLKSITLISAENGRQKIQKYAIRNNIKLSQINVYQRQLPTNNQDFDELTHGSDFYVLATSIITLKNLKILLDKKQWNDLKSKLIVSASSRIEDFAHEMGLLNTLNTNSANPKYMAKALLKFISGPK